MMREMPLECCRSDAPYDTQELTSVPPWLQVRFGTAAVSFSITGVFFPHVSNIADVLSSKEGAIR